MTASPGPANLSLAATAMAQGRRPALAMACGLAMGLAVWGLVALTGVSVILTSSPAVMSGLKLGGGCYLLWLALRSGRAAFASNPAPGADTTSAGAVALARRGLALNLLNPKAVLAWTATLAVGAPPQADASRLGAVVAVCALIGLGAYVAHALLFSVGGVMSAYRRTRRFVEAATALLLGTAGLGLIFWRARPQ